LGVIHVASELIANAVVTISTILGQ
jgi:hypothetical protein